MNLKAVLFDLFGTLAYVKDPISSEEISDFLLAHGYEIYPQSLDAASHYVSMIDYPKFGYKSWEAYLKQVFHRLNTELDLKTLEELETIYSRHRSLTLFKDATSAVKKVKALNLKTAIVTTIAHFCFASAIEPIRECFDFIMTGCEAGCEKSNPKMHKQVLKKLAVKPNDAVMIGDDLLVDVKIPERLSVHTIFLDRSGKTVKPNEADAKATTLTEAVDMVERWLKAKSSTNS